MRLAFFVFIALLPQLSLAVSSFDCERVSAGPSRPAKTFAHALSNAHAEIRFFGTHDEYAVADQALARILDHADPLQVFDLREYAQALVDACSLPASPSELSVAHIEMRGNVAWIRPGKGEVQIPRETRAAVIDLNGLPDSPEVETALRSLLEKLLDQQVAMPMRSVRKHVGLTDEGFRSGQVTYRNEVSALNQTPLSGSRLATLPLAFLVGKKLAPKAAEIAATLRLNNRAWIIGESIPTGIAELRWLSVGTSGISYRATDLKLRERRLPDEIRPDFTVDQLTTLDVTKLGQPPSIRVLASEGKRPRIKAIAPFGKTQAPLNPLGDLRAALLIAHGTSHLFYPKLPAGRRIRFDERLLEVLAHAPTDSRDRVSFRNSLRSLGEALRDGHNYVYDRTYRIAPEGAGFLPIHFDFDGTYPVVAASAAEGAIPGDRLVRIDDEDARSWLSTEAKRTSAGGSGYKIERALRELQIQTGSRKFQFLSPSGDLKTLELSPSTLETFSALKRYDYVRPSGWLSEYNASDVFYLNASSHVLPDLTALDQLLTDAKSARALIIDVRTSPKINAMALAARLIPREFKGPLYLTPVWNGPGESSDLIEPQRNFKQSPMAFTGQIILLTGPLTVSAAENVATYLADAGRVTIVGRPSAGTNGSMSGLQLPGQFLFTITAMKVQHANGELYRGLRPDVLAQPTYLHFGAGRDAELEQAVEVARK